MQTATACAHTSVYLPVRSAVKYWIGRLFETVVSSVDCILGITSECSVQGLDEATPPAHQASPGQPRPRSRDSAAKQYLPRWSNTTQSRRSMPGDSRRFACLARYLECGWAPFLFIAIEWRRANLRRIPSRLQVSSQRLVSCQNQIGAAAPVENQPPVRQVVFLQLEPDAGLVEAVVDPALA